LKNPFSNFDLQQAIDLRLHRWGTPEAGAGPMTEARNYRGFDPDGIANSKADHFGNCPVCGALLDMRDLAQMLTHVHDVEIEIGEATEPPPRDGPVQ
jgi:hypothetical protein